jgi:hypothetical protein
LALFEKSAAKTFTALVLQVILHPSKTGGNAQSQHKDKESSLSFLLCGFALTENLKEIFGCKMTQRFIKPIQ